MNCKSGIHYKVRRGRAPGQRSEYWKPETQRERPMGDIEALECAFCDFKVLKRHTRKPRTSKSGLGRYNRMRGAMVKHVHQEHREELDDAGSEGDG